MIFLVSITTFTLNLGTKISIFNCCVPDGFTKSFGIGRSMSMNVKNTSVVLYLFIYFFYMQWGAK